MEPKNCEFVHTKSRAFPFPIVELLLFTIIYSLKFCQFHHCDVELALCDWAPLTLYQLGKQFIFLMF